MSTPAARSILRAATFAACAIAVASPATASAGGYLPGLAAGRAEARVVLAVSPSHAPFGAPIVLTSTVSAVHGSGARSWGTVEIDDGGRPVAHASIVAGSARLTIAGLRVGRHRLVARLAGDPLHAAAASAPVEVTIGGRTAAGGSLCPIEQDLAGSART